MAYQTTNIAYHYTSIDTLLKLLDGIEDNRFMFYGSYILYMNDPTEFKYGLDMVRHLLPLIENELCVQNNICLSRIWDDDEIRERHFEMLGDSFLLPFVVSFSNHKDFLPQWITYGDNGKGVSLGFKIQDYCRIIKNGEYTTIDLTEFEEKQIHAIRVSYKRLSNKHVYNCFLRQLYKQYVDKISTIDAPNKIITIQLDYLREIAFILSALIKHKAYSYEDETRILVPCSKMDDVKFRTNVKGQIIPYIKIGIETNRLKKIVLGPCCDFESTKLMIETRLRQAEISNVKILKSQIPFR